MLVDAQQVVALIKKSSWFAGLPEAVIANLAAQARVREYQRGEYVYLVGDTLENLYCVVSGKVRISMISVEGQKFLITDLDGGQWFGETALAEQTLRVQEARAEANSLVISMSARSVTTIADKFPGLYKNVLFSHFRRTQLMYDLLAGMVFYPLKSRLAGRILHLAERHGRPTSDGIALEVKMSQLEFAQMTMGSRQRVNKVLRDWVQRGILRKQSEYYEITDVEALEAEVGPL